jgi:hypothetical protein
MAVKRVDIGSAEFQLQMIESELNDIKSGLDQMIHEGHQLPDGSLEELTTRMAYIQDRLAEARAAGEPQQDAILSDLRDSLAKLRASWYSAGGNAPEPTEQVIEGTDQIPPPQSVQGKRSET